MCLVCLGLSGLNAVSFAQSDETPETGKTVVFQNGEEGYNCYRIPAIVRSPNGLLLAFSEGRINDCGDFGNIDIVLKTSADQGATWSKLKVVTRNDGLQTGNSAPVYDLLDPEFPEGRLFLFYNTGTTTEHGVRQGKGVREIWYVASSDHGKTWSAPVNITLFVNKPNMPEFNPQYNFPEDWRTYANTPGHALQLSNGRILIPANHSMGPPQDRFAEYRAHAYFTDDHGKTWRLSEDVDYPGSNESTAAELPENGLLMSIRNQFGDHPYRLLARSQNGGETWDTVWVATDLPDPICQGSLLNFKNKRNENLLLHCNPDSQTERCCLTIKISRDGGEHWEKGPVVHAGDAAYSDLVQVDKTTVGALFETDDYRKIVFAKFSLED